MRRLLRCTSPLRVPSCPRLSRASTSSFTSAIKGVDGRDKPGHDEAKTLPQPLGKFLRSRDIHCPSFELCASCPRIRGRREDRAASATRSSACKNKKHADKSPQVCRTSPGLPCANGFNGFLRARPGDRALVSPWVTTHTRCTGYQRRDIRPTRLHRPRIKRIRLARCPRPSHPAPNVRDDRDTPLFSGARRAKNCQ